MEYPGSVYVWSVPVNQDVWSVQYIVHVAAIGMFSQLV